MSRRRRRPSPAPGTPAAPPHPRRLALLVFGVAVLVGLAAVAVSWLRRPPGTDAEARRRVSALSPAPGDLNVLVVTLDTTRADRLGCYGGPAGVSPHIDRLASEGLVFERAAATVPLTFPSHSSIFTGLAPPRHGVRDNGGFFLGDERTTLAERLRQAGWATGAFIGAWVLESRWGLAQGFDEYSDRFALSKYKVVSLGTVQKPADEVVDDAVRWMETVKDRRFFSWVHLYDPHTPYEPPEPYASRFPEKPYLGEIAYADQAVGRLVQWLQEKDLLRRTLVLVTADHGESLGDHGESAHAYFIYSATTHVPLVIRTPWGLAGRSPVQVSSVDIMPTVLDLVGLPPQEGIDGHSLARAVIDPRAALEHVAYSETYFPRYHFGWQHLRGVRDGRYFYVDAPEPELYDLSTDPAEAHNIYKAYSARAEPLRLRMEELAKAAAEGAPERQALDPETLQQLAALGYVGNVIDVDPTAILPDPKSKLKVFQAMSSAKRLAESGKVEQAVERMQQVLAEDPGIIDARITLGNWLMRLKRGAEAAEQFKQALALKPDDDIALGNLARAYLSRGREKDALDALEVFRTALRVNPKNPQSWYQLATIYLDIGRLDDAEASFKDALVVNARMGAAYNGLGVVAFTRGRVDRAEELFRKGLELEPRLRTAHYNLGRLREAKGDASGAEALYREELARYPDHGKARFNVAQILRSRGNRQGYLDELRRGIEEAPDFGPCYWFLAREELGAGRLDVAFSLAQRGLEAQPVSEVAPLGHYVLADVYNRRGEPAKAQGEVTKAQKIEAAMKRQPEPRI